MHHFCTDDSLHGPFKLVQEPQEDAEITNIRNVISWLETNSSNNKKGVFVAIVDYEESMLGL